MGIILAHATEILLLVFLTITFLQSGIDKSLDWKGNLGWLTEHFSDTVFKGVVPVLLGTILFMEVLSGVLCFIGFIQYLQYGQSSIGFYGALVASLTLLMLLLGQRIAKDYEGARTIVLYLIPAIFLVYLMQ